MASIGDVIRFIVTADGQPFRDDIAKDEAAMKTLDQSARDAGSKDGGMGLLGSSIMALLPLLSPLSAAAGGALIGLAGMATTAGAGFVGLGLVAKSNLTDIFQVSKVVTAQQTAYNNAVNDKQRQAAMLKAKQAWDSLDTSQQKALTSLQGFQKFWDGFSKSFETPVLNMFTNGLTLAQRLLTLLGPTISAAGGAFAKLEADASKALGSPFWAQFFKWMSKDTASSINSIGVSIGNIIKGLAGMFMAFSPGQKSMEQGLINLTKRFADWGSTLSSNKGFQSFVQYFMTNGPKVMQTLGSLGNLITQILKAMAPVGQAMLPIIKSLADFASKMIQANPQMASFAAGGMSIYGMLNMVRKPLPIVGTAMDGLTGSLGKLTKNTASFLLKETGITGFFTRLGGAFKALAGILVDGLKRVAIAFLTNPIALIITAIIAVIAIAVYEIVKHWSTIKKFLEDTWKEIKKVAEDVWNAVKKFFSDLWKGISDTAKEVWNTLVKWLKTFWNDEIQGWKNIWNALKTFFKDLWDGIKSTATVVWDAIRDFFKQRWENLVNNAKDIWNGLKTFFTGLWNDAKDWGGNLIRMFAQGVTNAVHWVEDAVKGVANTIKHWLGFHSPSAGLPDSDQWAPNFMKMFAAGLNDNVPLVDTAAQKATTSLKNQHNKRLANQAAAHQKALQHQQQTAQKMQQQREKAAQQAQQQTQTDNLRLQNIYQAYSQTMLNLRNNYAKQAAAIEDGLVKAEDAAMQKYTQAVDSRAQQLQQSMGLFSQVTHKQVSAQSLLGDIQDQVSTFEGWTNNLQALTKRGVDQGFLAELQKAGPQAADEVKALASMTDQQLQDYVKLWKQQSKDAHDEAVNELAPMKADTEAQIEALKKVADQKLQELTKTFDTNMANAKQKSLDQIKMLEQQAPPAITKAVQAMGSAMSAQLQTMLGQAQSYVAQINAVLSSVGGGLAPGTASMVQNGSRSSSSVSSSTLHAPVTIQVNAPVYGVNDLQAAIQQGVQQHVVPALQQALSQPARAITGAR